MYVINIIQQNVFLAWFMSSLKILPGAVRRVRKDLDGHTCPVASLKTRPFLKFEVIHFMSGEEIIIKSKTYIL